MSQFHVLCQVVLDSSLISAILPKIHQKKLRLLLLVLTVRTKNHDERYFASKVSKFLNSDHLEVVVDPKKILFDMDKIFENLCEPYGGSLASWYVYNNLNQNKVIFTGTGIDEIFGNYGKWKNFIISDFFVKKIFIIIFLIKIF